MFPIIVFSVAVHSCYIGSKVALSLFALQLGASQVTIGILAALYALVPLALGVYSGRLADTIGTRVPMLAGAVLVGIAMLISALGSGLGALFATAMLTGAGFLFFNVAVQTLTGAYGTLEQRPRNFSLLSIGYSISTFIGPVTVGIAIDQFGHARAFLILAAFTLIPVIALTLTGRFNRGHTRKNTDADRRALDLMRMPRLRSLIITSGLVVSAWDMFSFYLPVYAHSLGMSATSIGIVLGVYSVAAFITRFAMPALLRRWKPEHVMFVCMLTACVAFAIFPIWKHLYVILAISFFMGLSLGCGQPLSMMMAYDSSPPGRAGEVTGLRLTANNVARVVIPVVCGTLGGAFGAAPVFWLNSVNLAAICVLISRQ
jgi:MFS family permease